MHTLIDWLQANSFTAQHKKTRRHKLDSWHQRSSAACASRSTSARNCIAERGINVKCCVRPVGSPARMGRPINSHSLIRQRHSSLVLSRNREALLATSMAVCTIEMAATIASIPNVLFHAALPLRRPNLRVRPNSPLNLSILVLNFITMTPSHAGQIIDSIDLRLWRQRRCFGQAIRCAKGSLRNGVVLIYNDATCD